MRLIVRQSAANGRYRRVTVWPVLEVLTAPMAHELDYLDCRGDWRPLDEPAQFAITSAAAVQAVDAVFGDRPGRLPQ